MTSTVTETIDRLQTIPNTIGDDISLSLNTNIIKHYIDYGTKLSRYSINVNILTTWESICVLPKTYASFFFLTCPSSRFHNIQQCLVNIATTELNLCASSPFTWTFRVFMKEAKIGAGNAGNPLKRENKRSPLLWWSIPLRRPGLGLTQPFTQSVANNTTNPALADLLLYWSTPQLWRITFRCQRQQMFL